MLFFPFEVFKGNWFVFRIFKLKKLEVMVYYTEHEMDHPNTVHAYRLHSPYSVAITAMASGICFLSHNQIYVAIKYWLLFPSLSGP